MNLDDHRIYIDALLKRLMELLNNDKDELLRQVESLKRKYPGEEASWYLVKTIWNIEQERLLAEGLTRVKRPIAQKLPPPPPAKTQPKREEPLYFRPPMPKNTPPKPKLAPIQPSWKLLQLLNGDRKTAHRLLHATQLRHPDKPEQWVLEKVAWDLERDRSV